MPQFKTYITKTSYREVIITADDAEQAFDKAEAGAETLWGKGIESGPDRFDAEEYVEEIEV